MKIEVDEVVEVKYFTKPFVKLLSKYPELSSLLYSTYPPKFDLGDPMVLSTLNRYFFLDILGLDITVPQGHLIPSFGLRYAYCDIVMREIHNNKRLVEIGTGASAALSLILAKEYKRKVIASEINEESYLSAKSNIVNNGLEKQITLLKSKGEIISGLIPPGKYAALLCYPPIYSEDLTILKKRRGWKGVESELIGGGEDGLSFVQHLIMEYLDSEKHHFELFSILLLNLEQVKFTLSKIKKEIPHQIVRFDAGTRKRYCILFRN
ncbi:MAG: RlmF-related methyltransferase [Candidatus Heimdallarchaeaceae archaeon]